MLNRVGLDLLLRLLLLLVNGRCCLGFGTACPFSFGCVGHDCRHLGAADDSMHAENAFRVVDPASLKAPALRALAVRHNRAERGPQYAIPSFVRAFGLE